MVPSIQKKPCMYTCILEMDTEFVLWHMVIFLLFVQLWSQTPDQHILQSFACMTMDQQRGNKSDQDPSPAFAAVRTKKKQNVFTTMVYCTSWSKQNHLKIYNNNLKSYWKYLIIILFFQLRMRYFDEKWSYLQVLTQFIFQSVHVINL